MRKLYAIFVALPFVVAPLLAQEMPDELKAKLEAKATELNPDNPVGAKTWIGKQKAAWESLMNTTYAASPDDVDMIKKIAEEKFPLDYVAQESYISTACQSAAGLAEFEIPLGEEFKAMKEAAIKKAGGDFEKAYAELQAQAQAKSDLDSISAPAGMDEMTFSITKQVISNKFKGDYVAQLEAAKKQFSAEVGQAAAPEAGAQTAEAANTAEKVPASMSTLMNNSKKLFSENTLIVEGRTNTTATVVEIQGTKVVLFPSNAYVPGQQLSIINNVGEALVYNNDKVYISKNLPIVMIIPESIPSGVQPAKILPSKEYRSLVGKNMFFVGYQKQNIQAFPIKITSVSDNTLNLSTTVPGSFDEGTLLYDGESEAALATAIDTFTPLRKANWINSDDVKAFGRLYKRFEQRNLNKQFVIFRLDRLQGWEKLDDEKFTLDQEALVRVRGLVSDFIMLLSANRMQNALSCPLIGGLVKENYERLKSRSDPARFDKLYRQYLQETVMFISAEVRSAKVDSRYASVRSEMKNLVAILQNVADSLQKAQREGSYRSSYQDDIKQAQGMK